MEIRHLGKGVSSVNGEGIDTEAVDRSKECPVDARQTGVELEEVVCRSSFPERQRGICARHDLTDSQVIAGVAWKFGIVIDKIAETGWCDCKIACADVELENILLAGEMIVVVLRRRV